MNKYDVQIDGEESVSVSASSPLSAAEVAVEEWDKDDYSLARDDDAVSVRVTNQNGKVRNYLVRAATSIDYIAYRDIPDLEADEREDTNEN